MTESEEMSREEVYQRWLEWVIDNLGRQSGRTAKAAKAATDISMQGGGLSVAEEAAREAWATAGPRVGLKLPMWAIVGAASVVTLVLVGAVVVFATPAGCGVAQRIGLRVDASRCSINGTATSNFGQRSTSPPISPSTIPAFPPPQTAGVP